MPINIMIDDKVTTRTTDSNGEYFGSNYAI